MISVYLPTHNRREMLSRAVESVLAQRYKNFELIVVNDGSDDDTDQFLASIALHDARMRVLTNDSPVGACKSRNRAILAANGEFVTGLDDDDFVRPDHLSTLMNEYAKRSGGLRQVAVFPRIITRTKSGEKISKHQKIVVDQADLFVSNCVGNQVFTSREAILQAGLFDEQMPAWQDYEMWMRLARVVESLYCTNKLTYIQDESHFLDRTTNKNYRAILAAYLKCMDMHMRGATVKERLVLRINYHSYPQAPMSMVELTEYLKHGVILKPVYHFLKKRVAALSSGN